MSEAVAGAGTEGQATGEQSSGNENGESQVEAGAQAGAKEGEQAGSQAKEDGEHPAKMVRLEALHEERNARKELQRQMADIQRQQAQRDEIINRRLAALVPKNEVIVPDKAVDGVGYIDHQIGELKQLIQPVLQGQQAAAEQAQKENYVRQLADVVKGQVAELSNAGHDLKSVETHLNTVRARELSALGMPEHQARLKAREELENALLMWAHEGRNAAEVAHQIAVARGYQPKQAAVQSPQEKIESQQKGVRAAKSLGGGGAAGGGALTAESLAKMSDEDFAKLTDAQFEQAMGGGR